MSVEAIGLQKLGPEGRDKGPSLDLKFYVTDHSPDTFDTGNERKLQDLYRDIRKDGVSSVRYDWRWSNIEPESKTFDEGVLSRYANTPRVMKEMGLEPPTIVLSSIPAWALDLYKKDKKAFFSAYESYVEKVRASLSTAGQKIERVQVLNELNNPAFTPIVAEDIPRMCAITRDVFKEYDPNIKLLGTLVAGSLSNAAGGFSSAVAKLNIGKFNLGTGAQEYLTKHKNVIESFDSVAVDYYPGVWHKTLLRRPMSQKELFSELGLLTEVMERLAEMQQNGSIKEYEIGEVGLPTNTMRLAGAKGNEDRQRYFYDVFFRALKHVLVDFQMRKNPIPLPRKIGLYQAMDEPPNTTLGKILRAVGWPEHDFGMRQGNLEPKEILRGGRHVSEGVRSTQPSQLSNLIQHMNTPMRKFIPGEKIDIGSPEAQDRLANLIIEALKQPQILDDFRRNLQRMDKPSIELLVQFLEDRDMGAVDEGMALHAVLQQSSPLRSFMLALSAGPGQMGATTALLAQNYWDLRARLRRNEAFREMVPKLNGIITERIAEFE